MAEFDPKVLGGSVKRKIVNPDLLEERNKCNFDQKEMALLIIGADHINYIKQIDEWASRHPETQFGIEYYEMSREEKMMKWWRTVRTMMQSEDGHQYMTGNSSKTVKDRHWNWSSNYPGISPLILH